MTKNQKYLQLRKQRAVLVDTFHTLEKELKELKSTKKVNGWYPNNNYAKIKQVGIDMASVKEALSEINKRMKILDPDRAMNWPKAIEVYIDCVRSVGGIEMYNKIWDAWCVSMRERGLAFDADMDRLSKKSIEELEQLVEND